MAKRSGAIKYGRAFVELFADDTELIHGLRRAEATVRRFGQNVSRIGTRMTAASVAMLAPILAASRTFASFQDTMLAVKAASGATAAEFEKLTKHAQLMGQMTGWTAEQVAQGMLSLARAGFSVEEILNSLEAVMNLARATGTDIGASADIMTAAIRSFGLEAEHAGRIADVLTATANASAQTLYDLGNSLKMAAPIAVEFGMSIEETAKALGVLANMGIKGSMAGTSMRQLMLSLSDPKVQHRLRAFGVEVTDAQKQMRPFGDVMLEIGKVLSGLPSGEKLSIAKDLFSQRAVAAALKLSGTAGGMDRLAEAIDNATGSAKRQADEMGSGLGGSWRILKAAMESVQHAISQALEPTLKKAANSLKDFLTGIAGTIERNQEFVRQVVVGAAKLGMYGAAIWAVGKAFVALSVAIKIVRTAIMAMKAVAIAMATPWVIVPLLIGAAVTAAIVGMTDITQSFKTGFSAMVDALKSGNIELAGKAMWQTLKILWQESTGFLADIWDSLLVGFAKNFHYMGAALTATWMEVAGGISGAWTAVLNGIKSGWASVAGWIQKRWIEMKGFFDSSIDVEAEIQKIVVETQEKQDQAALDTKQKWSRIKAETESALNKIWAGIERQDEKLVGKMTERAERLQKLKDELHNLTRQAQAEKEEAAEKAAGAIGAVGGFSGALATQAKMESRVGFEIGRLFGWGAGDSAQKKGLQVAEQSRDLLKRIERNTAEGTTLAWGT